MKPRRTFTAEQKMTIICELLEEKIHISQLAEKYEIHPKDIYNLKKKLFESAADVFGSNKQKSNKTESENKIKYLEDKIKKREEAISYLLQDNNVLKKSIDGLNLTYGTMLSTLSVRFTI